MLLQRSQVMVSVAALLLVLSGLVGLLQLRGTAFLPTRVVPVESDAPIESEADLAAALEEKCQTLRQGCETQCGYWSPEYQVEQCFPACATEYEACATGELAPDGGIADRVSPERALLEEGAPATEEIPVLPEITE